jgi:hypothetical protein
MDDYPTLTATEDTMFTDLFLAFHPDSWNATLKLKRELLGGIFRHKDISNMNPIFPPARPSSPSIKTSGAPAGFWTEDLCSDKLHSKSPIESEKKKGS